MSIPVKCRCGERFRAPEKRAGKSTRCPCCDRLVDVPWGDEEDEESNSTIATKRIKKKKKSGSGTAKRLLVFSLVALLTVAVLGGGGVGVYFLIRKFTKLINKSPGDGFAVHEKYLPDDPKGFVSYHFARIPSRTTDDQGLGGPEADRLGMHRKDILRMTSSAVDGPVNPLTIITTNVPIDVERLVRNDGGTEVTVGKYTMYRGEPHVGWVDLDTKISHTQTLAWAVPETYVFLTGPADALEAILKRDGKPQLSDRMRKGMELVNYDYYTIGVDNGDHYADVDLIASYHERSIDSNLVDSVYKVYKDPETAERKRQQWDAEERLNTQRRGSGGVSGLGRTDTVTRDGNKVIHTMTLTGGHPR